MSPSRRTRPAAASASAAARHRAGRDLQHGGQQRQRRGAAEDRGDAGGRARQRRQAREALAHRLAHARGQLVDARRARRRPARDSAPSSTNPTNNSTSANGWPCARARQRLQRGVRRRARDVAGDRGDRRLVQRAQRAGHGAAGGQVLHQRAQRGGRRLAARAGGGRGSRRSGRRPARRSARAARRASAGRPTGGRPTPPTTAPPAPAPPAAAPARRAARRGRRRGPASSSSGSGPSASSSGATGRICSSGWVAPRTAPNPERPAIATASSSSRVLPIPAAPSDERDGRALAGGGDRLAEQRALAVAPAQRQGVGRAGGRHAWCRASWWARISSTREWTPSLL